MFSNLTLNSIFWLFFGVLLAIGGGYIGYSWRMYPFAMGLGFLGIGSVLCGITNGFTDYSPLGRLFWKVGILTILMGLGLTIYYLVRFI
jgi:hypothetical protein